MTSRERVRRAVTFEGPDRVPISLPEEYGTDIKGIGASGHPDWKPSIKTETKWEDEWGCIWERIEGDITMGQVTGHPLDDYAKLPALAFPDYKDARRYANAKEQVEKHNDEERFVLAGTPVSFFHRLEYLRGHDNAWTDPYLEPDNLEQLLDKLADIAVDSIRNFAEIGADGITSADDMGLQNVPKVSPEIFRRFFKPRFARVYGVARELGLLTFLHSCGYIIDFLDDLVDAGLQVIQMDQQENMGLDNLREGFGGRLCFWCPVDIQHTMVEGSPEDVADYARTLIDKLGTFNGGFIAKWYPSPDAVEHSWENIRAMSKAFVEHGAKVYGSTSEA